MVSDLLLSYSLSLSLSLNRLTQNADNSVGVSERFFERKKTKCKVKNPMKWKIRENLGI